ILGCVRRATIPTAHRGELRPPGWTYDHRAAASLGTQLVRDGQRDRRPPGGSDRLRQVVRSIRTGRAGNRFGDGGGDRRAGERIPGNQPRGRRSVRRGPRPTHAASGEQLTTQPATPPW